MSTDSEDPVERPEPVIGEPVPVEATETPAESADRPTTENPVVAPAYTTTPATTPVTAAAYAPVTTRTVTSRAPWWHYLAVGVAGMIIGTLLTLSSVAVVSHVRNGFGPHVVQRYDRRPGHFGPRQFGPNQGPGPRFNGPRTVQPAPVQPTPVPAPTATG